MNPDGQTAITARAHQIWEESSRVHGQDVQHWRQAERERDEAEAPAATVEHFNAEPIEVASAKLTRKRIEKAAEPTSEVPAASARKPRVSRKASAPPS